MTFYFLFSLKIQQTTKQKNFLHIRKIKRKSNFQSKTFSQGNTLNSKGLTLERHSEVTVVSLEREKGNGIFNSTKQQ